MKESTYSVFVRFRRRQRLTLKRSVPLDVALRFAATVRGERFHRPEDVFIIDDLTGETVSEVEESSPASVEAPLEIADAAGTQERSAGPRAEVQALSSRFERWQIRHAQMTVRGGHRLTAAVERSLAQLSRLMDLLRSSNALLGEAEQVAADTSIALEHIRHAQEVLQRAEAKLTAAPLTNDALEALTVTSLGEPQPNAPKRLLRGKD